MSGILETGGPSTVPSVDATTSPRNLFMVLSPRSLPYARLALSSLHTNCVERFSLTLITDSADDVQTLQRELDALEHDTGDRQRRIAVRGETDLADLESDRFGNYPHLQHFRRGHPCWRKITDPVLLSDDRQELIVLDPDLYFPNRFRFEETPGKGLSLMWQRPSCLLPDEVVEAAFRAGISLAHHTDIGVVQWRAPVDLEWLNWLVREIGSSRFPRHMHVESIVWAALAMKMGGGYLDPASWVCWHRSQYKRLLVKFGVSGPSILEREKISGIKCFHAGGVAKWWLAGAHARGLLDRGEDATHHTSILPFIELKPSYYHLLQLQRRWLDRLGYYSILGG